MADAPAVFETERPRKARDMKPVIREIAAKTGSSVGFLPEWLKLNMGPGRLLFDEYLDMRLWDPALYPRTELKSFIGNWGMVKIWRAANFIPGAQALAAHKIAAAAVLGAYGLSVPPLLGLHATGALPGGTRSATAEELEDFLLRKLAYPAFGKPLQGIQSLGSISLDGIDSQTGLLACADGRKIAAAVLAEAIHSHYAKSGYIFQPRLPPHDAVRAVCGNRLATVRVVTIFTAEGPRVLRACWKIPAGANSVDNFWRKGNILAAIGLESGSVLRAISGTGLDMQEVEKHPDTGAAFAGLKVPLWEEIRAAALAGAAALSDFGLLGWDIAATKDGPVVIEVNETPDVMMIQIAHRKGLLDAPFAAFMDTRRAAFQAWKAEQKKIMQREYGRVR
ncbi:MAG: hypothetical protein KGL10_01825 [Alphaproteobacteria bacterium]|nr:hypothetical protein [Alphaproteobacteria bacterium]